MKRFSKLTNARTSPNDHHIRKNLTSQIRKKIAQLDLTLAEVGNRMEPRRSASGVHHLLSGEQAICISVIDQLCNILGISLAELVENSKPKLDFEYIFTEDQEAFIMKSTLHLKVTKAFALPSRVTDIQRLFIEHSNEIPAIVDELIHLKIIECEANGLYRLTKDGVASIKNHSRYNEIISKLFGETYENCISIFNESEEAINFQRSIVFLEYLTPEQITELREETKKLKWKVTEMLQKNRSLPELQKQARKSFTAIIFAMAPLNRGGFLKQMKKVKE